MPFVYLLRCRDGSLYAGATKDLGARLGAHQRGQASRYTRARLPVRLVYSRRVATWSGALREEHRLKQLEKVAKEALVAAARKRRKLRVESRRAATARGRSAGNKEKT